MVINSGWIFCCLGFFLIHGNWRGTYAVGELFVFTLCSVRFQAVNTDLSIQNPIAPCVHNPHSHSVRSESSPVPDTTHTSDQLGHYKSSENMKSMGTPPCCFQIQEVHLKEIVFERCEPQHRAPVKFPSPLKTVQKPEKVTKSRMEEPCTSFF